MVYDENTEIETVIHDPVFKDYGHLLFPLNQSMMSGKTLKELKLFWYSCIDSKTTVEIVNYCHNHAHDSDFFFNPYTEDEIQAEPDKKEVGVFFFKGKENAPFAICVAGGGFEYVGAMQDSFPHALELSKQGYNAFVLIYRPDPLKACKDLSRTIATIFTNHKKVKVNPHDYSLWGGSAGARVALWVAERGTASFNEKLYPKPSALIIQYSGHREYCLDEPATFCCVGKKDTIASWRLMQRRIERLKELRIDTEFCCFENLGHGFGLGKNTEAEGWINQAIAFWERQMRSHHE